MRTSMHLGLLLAGAATVTTGCKWTEFDDLEKEAWVSTTTQPGGTTDFGLAMQRGVTSSGGKLAVMGSSEVVYYQLVFSGNGDVDVGSGQDITNQTSVPGLAPQPIFLADPATNDVALVMEGLGGQMYVWHGDDMLNVVTINGASTPDAATFMVAPDLMAVAQPSQPLVASGDTVYGAHYPDALNTPFPKCQLLDGTPVQIRALGAVKLDMLAATDPHDVVVWGADGGLRLYESGIFHGSRDPACASETASPHSNSVTVATGYMPGKGSHLIMLEDRYALLVGHRDVGMTGDGFLGLYDLRATNGANQFEPALVGAAITNPDLRTATVMDIGAQKYVVAGYPNATIDGAQAGQVHVFPLSLTTGLTATPALTLHDAQPEGGQQFGRAVAVTQFNGSPVIAVGADNEVFFYFRTALYDETRQ